MPALKTGIISALRGCCSTAAQFSACNNRAVKAASLIALAGAVGTLARWGLSAAVYARLGEGFPWGTLAVNVLGCFIFGVVMQAWATNALGDTTRALVCIGFLGAFTTFSTFSYDTVAKLQEGQWLVAGGNVLGSVAAGLLAVWAGIALARVIWGAA